MDTDTGYFLPWNPDKQEDIDAVETNLQFKFGIYNDPLHFGDWPPMMKEYINDRLPQFSDDEKKLVKGSFDFIGVNHYTTSYVIHTGIPGIGMQTDPRLIPSPLSMQGEPIGPRAESKWLYVYPEGMRGLLNWIADRYNNTKMYVFENGVSVPGENDLPIEEAIHDDFRANYYRDYIN